MLYNQEEFSKMDYTQKVDYFKKCEKEAVEYQTKTKSDMVLDMALFLKKSGYPVKEIKHKLLEDLGDLVTGRYIDMCLTEEFKPRQIAKKEKVKQKQVATLGASGETILEPAASTNTKANREELSRINEPSVVNENTTPEEISAPPINAAYVESLEQQIAALKAEIPYTDMLATHRIVKLDRITQQSLINASKKCLKYIYMTIDIRTNELTKAIADKDYKKETKAVNKNDKQKTKSKKK